jgi:hypothetical protein
MTLKTLPPAPKDVGRLSDVFVSALGAITGGPDNRLKLPRTGSAIVVLVDGLGYLNLKENAGHARFLTKLLIASGDRAIRSGFPSTTAVSLTSFGTGLQAGSHGILGYQVLGQDGKVRNMLNGWGSTENPRDWQSAETIAERAMSAGIHVSMVAASEYQGSGFTNVIMGAVPFIPTDDLVARAAAAHRLASQKNTLVYLYFAELDQAAHRFGVDSAQWLSTLEDIDSALSQLVGDYGLIVTADHGITDVSSDQHVYLDEVPGFPEAVRLAVGDPRALFCYGDSVAAYAALNRAGVSAYLSNFEELESLGWVSGDHSRDQVPDFVLIASGADAFYDRRTAKVQSLKMVGQHGGISDRETRVPLIRAGGFL